MEKIMTGVAGQGALAVVHEEIHAGLPQDEPAGSGRTTRDTARQSQVSTWSALLGSGSLCVSHSAAHGDRPARCALPP